MCSETSFATATNKNMNNEELLNKLRMTAAYTHVQKKDLTDVDVWEVLKRLAQEGTPFLVRFGGNLAVFKRDQQ